MKKSIVLIITLLICMLFAVSLLAGTEPGVFKLDSISEKYGPVMFDHSKHTSLSGNCGQCHHQHGNSSTLPCKECHSLTPDTFKHSVSSSFMACKNCHGTLDRSNPGMPSLKVAYHRTCFQCHRGMSNVGTDPKGCAEMCHPKKGGN